MKLKKLDPRRIRDFGSIQYADLFLDVGNGVNRMERVLLLGKGGFNLVAHGGDGNHKEN
ncbi:hypothetical protein HanIR_Chr15g0755151 [Helianthus annuus]|nr:hypothetical protein HanIR_Chr15g0755151 [Helianthus annuus]